MTAFQSSFVQPNLSALLILTCRQRPWTGQAHLGFFFFFYPSHHLDFFFFFFKTDSKWGTIKVLEEKTRSGQSQAIHVDLTQATVVSLLLPVKPPNSKVHLTLCKASSFIHTVCVSETHCNSLTCLTFRWTKCSVWHDSIRFDKT